MSDLLLLLQLVFGLAVVLAPGALLARTLGVRGAPAVLAWSLAIVFGALTVTFLVGATLTLTLVLMLASGAAALACHRFPTRSGAVARVDCRRACGARAVTAARYRVCGAACRAGSTAGGPAGAVRLPTEGVPRSARAARSRRVRR